jgi:hypothetical protein
VTVAEKDPLAFLRVRELTWLDLVLPDETLAELRALAASASGGGLVALVTGGAGVGKTIAVRTIAEQLRLDTWRVDCRLLVELRGDATDAALPELLAVGDRPHAVLLFHDVEWLFAPAAGSAGKRLLDLAPARLPPTVLETGAPELLPEALTGLPRVVIPAPDVAARAELWRRLAWRAHPLAVLDVERLAAIPAPGAQIERALDRVVDEAGGREPDTERLLAALGDAPGLGRSSA